MLLACGFSLLSTSLVFISSSYKLCTEGLTMRKSRDGCILFLGGYGECDVDLYIDEQALGPQYGQVIRKAFIGNRAKIRSLAVHLSVDAHAQYYDIILLVGAHADRHENYGEKKVFVVNPSKPPRDGQNKSARKIFLPEYDIHRVNALWEEQYPEVAYIKDSGQYVSDDFENILAQCCEKS